MLLAVLAGQYFSQHSVKTRDTGRKTPTSYKLDISINYAIKYWEFVFFLIESEVHCQLYVVHISLLCLAPNGFTEDVEKLGKHKITTYISLKIRQTS